MASVELPAVAGLVVGEGVWVIDSIYPGIVLRQEGLGRRHTLPKGLPTGSTSPRVWARSESSMVRDHT